MGYTTEFTGEFSFDQPLSPEHAAYLTRFAGTRRMGRREDIAGKMPDPVREVVGLPLGPQGAYFVGGQGVAGQEVDSSVIHRNKPPDGQPGLWCQWVPTKNRRALVWDGEEKFYNFVEWLQYLLAHFLTPWGYSLRGTVRWCGEEPGDEGVIEVRDSRVIVREES